MYIIHKYIYMYNIISQAKTCILTNKIWINNQLKSITGNYLGEK